LYIITAVSYTTINIGTVNTFKNIFQLYWNRKLLNYISYVLFEIDNFRLY